MMVWKTFRDIKSLEKYAADEAIVKYGIER